MFCKLYFLGHFVFCFCSHWLFWAADWHGFPGCTPFSPLLFPLGKNALVCVWAEPMLWGDRWEILPHSGGSGWCSWGALHSHRVTSSLSTLWITWSGTGFFGLALESGLSKGKVGAIRLLALMLLFSFPTFFFFFLGRGRFLLRFAGFELSYLSFPGLGIQCCATTLGFNSF